MRGGLPTPRFPPWLLCTLPCPLLEPFPALTSTLLGKQDGSWGILPISVSQPCSRQSPWGRRALVTPKEGQLCLFQTRALPGAAARKAKPQSWVFIPFSTFIPWDFDPVPGLCVPSTSPAVGAGTWQRGRHGTRSPPRVTQLGKGCQEHAAARWVLVPASPQTSDPRGDVRGFLFPVFPSKRCGSCPALGTAPAL